MPSCPLPLFSLWVQAAASPVWVMANPSLSWASASPSPSWASASPNPSWAMASLTQAQQQWARAQAEWWQAWAQGQCGRAGGLGGMAPAIYAKHYILLQIVNYFYKNRPVQINSPIMAWIVNLWIFMNFTSTVVGNWWISLIYEYCLTEQASTSEETLLLKESEKSHQYWPY